MKRINQSKYAHRLLARFVIEAETPLAVGSGEKDILTDALVATDVNELPYIPGTAIAGVMRHAIGEERAKEFFGKHVENSKDCQGSEIIFSEAKMIGSDGKVVDGLKTIDFDKDPFYAKFKELPIRQHAKITDKGVTASGGKFDEQVVYQGTRFVFEIEMVSEDKDGAPKKLDDFLDVLRELNSQTLRIGSGTRSGFGKIAVKKVVWRKLDLTNSADLECYLNKSSDLSQPFEGDVFDEAADSDKWVTYELMLQPEDFFLFGSGFGDEDVDMTPVKEEAIGWDENGKPHFKKNDNGDTSCVLIPATSLKGAIAHRTAYHYNRLKERYVDGSDLDKTPKAGRESEVIRELFGYESQDEKFQKRGNVIFDDIIQCSLPEKVLNHVSIDRFTGGAIESALFDEKVLFGNGKSFTTKIMVDKTALDKDPDYRIAFECALKDLVDGTLPLGGGVNRGNGCFGGSVKEIDGTFKHNRVIESW